MHELLTRKAAILAKIAAIQADRTTLRERLQEKAQALAEVETMASRWKTLAEMTLWAELDSGAAISEGQRVRYLMHTYECIQAHTKALTRRPTVEQYWKEME